MANPSGRTEYLEATLGLVKRLEISKELILECVTVPGCCCCMPLLHNHLMVSCSYVRKNTLLAAKGGCICTPLTPPKSATDCYYCLSKLLLFTEPTDITAWRKWQGHHGSRFLSQLQFYCPSSSALATSVMSSPLLTHHALQTLASPSLSTDNNLTSTSLPIPHCCSCPETMFSV